MSVRSVFTGPCGKQVNGKELNQSVNEIAHGPPTGACRYEDLDLDLVGITFKTLTRQRPKCIETKIADIDLQIMF